MYPEKNTAPATRATMANERGCGTAENMIHHPSRNITYMIPWRMACRKTLVGKMAGFRSAKPSQAGTCPSGRHVFPVRPSPSRKLPRYTLASQEYDSRWLANGTAMRNQNEKPDTAMMKYVKLGLMVLADVRKPEIGTSGSRCIFHRLTRQTIRSF